MALTGSSTRALMPEKAAMTWPKSVMSALVKFTSVGLGGLDRPAGRAMSIDATLWPCAIKSRNNHAPQLAASTRDDNHVPVTPFVADTSMLPGYSKTPSLPSLRDVALRVEPSWLRRADRPAFR